MIGKHVNNYDSRVLAELYDMEENYTSDIDFLRELISDKGKLNILECFTGTGRMLIPLAKDGHRLTGIELSSSMLERARQKLDKLSQNIRDNVTLINDDILKADWGSGYDLIVFGCNAFYELPSPETQQECMRKAYAALKNGGFIYADNDDYKGKWGQIKCGVERTIFEGVISDGTFGRMTLQHDSFEEGRNILDFTHKLYIRNTDNTEETFVYRRSKHPVTAKEVKQWLEDSGFNILQMYGDWQGNPFSSDSKRGIFWAVKS
jgi:SAM-dependent methyltransferase